MRASILASFLVLFFLSPLAEAADKTPSPDSARELVVGVLEDPPFAMQDALGNWQGIAIDLWEAVAKDIGLSFKYKEMPEPQIDEALAQGKLDAVVGGLIITPERENKFEFSQVFYTSDLAIAVPKRPDKSILMVLLQTLFSWDFLQIILAICAVLFFAGFIIWLVERRSDPEGYGGHWSRGIFAGFYWSGAMMSGCGDKTPRTIHGRLFAIIWIFVGIFLTSSFTASIANILNSERLFQKTITAEDLPHYRIALLQGSYEELCRQMRIRYTTYPTEKEALKAILENKADASILSEPDLHHAANKYFPDKFAVTPMSFRRIFYAIGLPEGSPLLESVNRSLLEVIAGSAWQDTLNRYLDH